MKKFKLAFVALAAACLIFTGCGNEEKPETAETSASTESNVSEKTPSEKTAELLSAVQFPEMVEVTVDKLLAYYGIDSADVQEMSAYRVGSGAFPDQFGIFVATDADAAARVKSAIEAYVESERTDFADYTPNEMYKFDDSFIKINGNSVYYAVCADNAKAESVLA